MASLVEELVKVLEQENSEYEMLLELSRSKTPVIVGRDVKKLQSITDEEQIVVSRLNRLEQKREEVFQDIANVINKDVKELKLKSLIDMMESQPKEKQRLSDVYKRLQDTITIMRQVNEHNGELIQLSLEMVEFDLNLIQSMRLAPETANYNRGAENAGNFMGHSRGSFDTKQ